VTNETTTTTIIIIIIIIIINSHRMNSWVRKEDMVIYEIKRSVSFNNTVNDYDQAVLVVDK
jgi:hypothetical protein